MYTYGLSVNNGHSITIAQTHKMQIPNYWVIRLEEFYQHVKLGLNKICILNEIKIVAISLHLECQILEEAKIFVNT